VNTAAAIMKTQQEYLSDVEQAFNHSCFLEICSALLELQMCDVRIVDQQKAGKEGRDDNKTVQKTR